MNPDISVIIPTYRRPGQLLEAIRSVTSQKEVTTEILVIDDCPDGSAAPVVAPLAGAGVRYIRNELPTHGRPAVVRNLGWPLATGDLVHFLDDDDIVPSGYYATARQALQQNPAAGVVFGAIAPFGDVNLKAEQHYFSVATRRARQLSWLGPRLGLGAWMYFGPTLLVCSAAIIRRSCIAQLNGFDTTLPLVEDVDFYARAIHRFGAVVLPDASIQYRIGPSLMRTPGRDNLIERSYKIMHSRYRSEYGPFHFFAAKGFTRLLRILPC